jgi:predicted transcriptional regulator
MPMRIRSAADEIRQVAMTELDEETLAAILEGLAHARRGEFVSDEAMQAFFERHGVKPY